MTCTKNWNWGGMTLPLPAKLDIDLYAGPGGWDQGRRMLCTQCPQIEVPLLGFEWNPDAVATAVAAGHPRLLGDVAAQDLAPWVGRVRGLIGSPPCGGMSGAGGGPGRIDIPTVRDLLNLYAMGVDDCAGTFTWADERSPLTAEPMRWIHALGPAWIALEQVPAVAPIWAHYVELLHALGYRAWSGIVSAQDHGVASTRKRAVLLASRSTDVGPPPVSTPRPVTMGETLGIADDGRVLVSNYGTGGDPKARGRRRLDQPAPTMTGKCGRNRWIWPDGTSRNLTVAEAGVLTGFPADYPWHGGSTAQQQQVGDAVPPPLAAALLRPLMVEAREEEAA